MARKSAELAALGIEDLDRLLAPSRNNLTPPRRRQSSQVDFNDDIEFAPAELDTHFEMGMGVAEVVKRTCSFVFITLEHEQSSVFATYLDYLTKTVIILAVVAYLLSTEPAYRDSPSTCDQPVCSDDDHLCPGYQVCEPEESLGIFAIENFTTYYFTAEYLLRMLTAWSVTPRVAGVLSYEWEQRHNDDPGLAQPVYSSWLQTTLYFWRVKLVIDLATILPSYLPYLTPNGVRVNTNFVRTLRLLRLVRLLKVFRLLTFLKNVDVAMDIIWETLRKSSLLLSTFLFFIIILYILMGCLIYLAEQGTFTVTQQYPNGAYLKPNDDETGQKVSNIFSAVQGIYWAIGGGTLIAKSAICRVPVDMSPNLSPAPSHSPWLPHLHSTGTGNSDLAPTSEAGKLLQCMISIVGMISLAVPTGIIGNELNRTYTRHFRRLKERAETRERVQIAATANKAASATVAKELQQQLPQQPPPQLQGGLNINININIPPLLLLGLGGGGPAVTTAKAFTAMETQARRQASRNFRRGAFFRYRVVGGIFVATNLPFSHAFSHIFSRQAAMKFKDGEFPPFPPGTRLAVTQAIIEVAWREGRLLEQQRKVERLRRQYNRALAAKPPLTAKYSAEGRVPPPSVDGSDQAAGQP